MRQSFTHELTQYRPDGRDYLSRLQCGYRMARGIRLSPRPAFPDRASPRTHPVMTHLDFLVPKSTR